MLYIGIALSIKPVVPLPVPHGDARLPAQALKLENDNREASEKAVQAGKAWEDDSKGYALSTAPAKLAFELEIRKFTLGHSQLVRRFLRTSGDVEHRRVTAEFLRFDHASDPQV